jgi:Alpha/beta hydrolase family
MTIARALRNTLILLLSICGLMVSMIRYQQPVLIPISKPTTASATLVYLPGFHVLPEAYRRFLEAIQVEFEADNVTFGLTCIIAKYPKLFNLDIPPFWGTEAMVTHALTFLKSTTSQDAPPLFIGGHSLGGVLAQLVAFNKLKTASRFSGLLLHSAFIRERYRGEKIPVPTLTISGTRDGLNRLTAVAMQFLVLGRQPLYRVQTPTILIEGMNHMQLADIETKFHLKRDLPSTISTSDAQALAAKYSARFLLNCLGLDIQHQDLVKAMQLSEERYFDPYIKVLEADISGSTCVLAQNVVFGAQSGEREVYSDKASDHCHVFAFSKPKVNETHAKVETYTARAYSFFGRSSSPQAVQTLYCKMSNKEDQLFGTVDCERCVDINQAIIDRVLRTLPRKIQSAYLHSPNRFTFDHDIEHNTGLGWLRDKLRFLPTQRSVVVLCPRLKTAPGTARYSGKLYCQFVSQSRAYEHIMIDSNRLRPSEELQGEL